jgi:O-antigen/teichoic acid export membrane protein
VVLLGLLVSLSFCLLLFLFTILFPGYIASWLHTGSDFTIYLYFIPLSVLFSTWYQILNYWLLRNKAFKASSINKIAQTFFTGTVNLVSGMLKFSKGMLTGDLIGKGFAVCISFYQCKKSSLHFKNVNGLKKTAYKFREYPLFNALPAFLDTLSLNLPVLIVGAFYNNAALGFFGLSRLVLGAPLSLISTSINQVYFQKISESKNQNKPVLKDVTKLLVMLTLLFLPAYLILFFFSETLFAFIFGEKWIMAGTITSIIAITYYMKFVISPLSIVFPALNAIKTGSVWSVIYFIALYSLFYFNPPDFTGFLYLLNYIEICVYTLYLVLIIYTVRKYDQSLIGNNTENN